MIAFAALLSLRKKYPTLRVGRVYAWMQAHVWLGTVCFPLILFHAGFSLGGPLTTGLMVLLTTVVVSGICGLALQQFIPALMQRTLPTEIIYERADDELARLRQELDEVFGAATEHEKARPKPGQVLPPEGTPERQVLQEFYQESVLPFLTRPSSKTGVLATEEKANAAIGYLRKLIPPEYAEILNLLQTQIEKRRLIARQVRLHHILHGWLIVHVPLSLALILLAAIHAIAAMRYS
jgi:hypothetical protein